MTTVTYEEMLEKHGYLYWKTVGVSMRPLIREGRDTILIQKCTPEQLKKYDVVLFRRPVITEKSTYVLHRILKINPNGTCWIVGDNCFSGETVKNENILGVLTMVKRHNKSVPMTDFRYRLYTHLWCDFYPLRFFLLRYRSYPKAVVKKILRVMRLKKP